MHTISFGMNTAGVTHASYTPLLERASDEATYANTFLLYSTMLATCSLTAMPVADYSRARQCSSHHASTAACQVELRRHRPEESFMRFIDARFRFLTR